MDKVLFDETLISLLNEFKENQKKLTNENISKIEINYLNENEIVLSSIISRNGDEFDYLKYHTFADLFRALIERMEGIPYSDRDMKDTCFVSRTMISKYINHGKTPTAKTLIRLCIGLNVGMFGFIHATMLCDLNLYAYPILLSDIAKILDTFTQYNQETTQYRRCDAKPVLDGKFPYRKTSISYKIDKYDEFEKEWSKAAETILNRRITK